MHSLRHDDHANYIRVLRTFVSHQCFEHNAINYELFRHWIQYQFIEKIKAYGEHGLFIKDCGEKDLFEKFLEHLPPAIRQYYTCRACEHFVNFYGRTVFITETGTQIPAMWEVDGTPEPYRDSVMACYNKVKNAEKPAANFVCNEMIWGTPSLGGYTHMAVIPPAKWIVEKIFLPTIRPNRFFN